MKRLLLISLTFISLSAFGQNDFKTQTQAIVVEGKLLYKSEMASWYGTDLFLENHKDRTNVGGYFSYTIDEISKCVFFSKTDKPKVIGTISFDSSFSTKSAKIDLTERCFTNSENDLYTIRKIALEKLNSDTLFKRYNNTDLNLIPLASDNEKKVYVLTGPKQNGVVIFGNDYLLTFDNNNSLSSTKRLHKNIIPIRFGDKQKEGKEVEATIHSHLPETGDFITATDICTLMLYEKFTKWKRHNVVSKKYLNIWDCETNELNVIPMETIQKINNDQKNKRKQNE
ncbi:MAG: hypothetical protein Q8904_10495 [Bacteroidota bacterium]|nr:hypothetical protein [Bacteroidota bacterium]